MLQPYVRSRDRIGPTRPDAAALRRPRPRAREPLPGGGTLDRDTNIRLWDGEVLIRLAEWEARMSHWIRTPRAVDGRTGRTVFDLTPWPSWDLCDAREEAERAILELRRYPDGGATARLERALSAALRRATGA